MKQKTAGLKNEPIVSWKVCFTTPFGVVESLNDAIKICEENNFDANLCIIPVAVAITKTSYEMVIK